MKPEQNKSQPKVALSPMTSALTPIELVSARNLAVHHQNLFLKKVVMGLSALLAVSFLLNFVLASREPEDKYFATTPQGVITKIEPLDRPMLSNPQVSAFAVEAVTETLSLTFASYEKDLNAAQEYYRPDAFRSVLDTLRNAGFLKEIVENFFTATAIPIEAPLIVREGERGGTYAWEVKFPISIRLQSKDGTKSVVYNASAVVERAPSHLRPRHLALSRLVLTTR